MLETEYEEIAPATCYRFVIALYRSVQKIRLYDRA